MELTRRKFNGGLFSWLGLLLLGKGLQAEEGLIKPTLEEISLLMSKDPSEILAKPIEQGDIRRFTYTQSTRPQEINSFLDNNFQNQIIFVYLCTDKSSDVYDPEVHAKVTFDRQAGVGPAIAFLYTRLNLRKFDANIGFLYIELNNLHGKENWARLLNYVSVNQLDIPSFAEFVRDSNGRYKINGVTRCGFIKPESIWKSIEVNVKEYSKK